MKKESNVFGPEEGDAWYCLVEKMHEIIGAGPGEAIGFLPVFKSMEDATNNSNGEGQLIKITRRKKTAGHKDGRPSKT